MTAEDRMKEISQMCGMSEHIVRAVLKAEADSVAQSLIAGQNAVLLGRCIIKPRNKDGKVCLSCVPSNSLRNLVEEKKIDLDALQEEPVIQHIQVEQLEELL